MPIFPVPILSGIIPKVSDHFGFSEQRGRLHAGADIMYPRQQAGDLRLPEFSRRFFMPSDVPALAFNAGVVTRAGQIGTGGRVEIDHGNGFSTKYFHLSKLLVKAGDAVKAGDSVGIIGHNPDGFRLNHLHFEILQNGRQIDPEPLLVKAQQVALEPGQVTGGSFSQSVRKGAVIGIALIAGAGVLALLARRGRKGAGLGFSGLDIQVTNKPEKFGSPAGFEVCATDSEGKKQGCVTARRAAWMPYDERNGVKHGDPLPLEVVSSWVHGKGRGLGTELYHAAAVEACRRGVTLQSDMDRSDAAEGFWKKQIRKGRAVRRVAYLTEEKVTYYRLSCPAPDTLGAAKHSLYSMPDRWWVTKVPKDRLCYKTKTEALRKFMDWNTGVVEDYGGPTAKGSRGEFDALTKFEVSPTNIAEALWVSLPAPPRGRQYCLEDIDVEALNDTSPGKDHPVGFQLPDFVLESRLVEDEYEYYRHRGTDGLRK